MSSRYFIPGPARPPGLPILIPGGQWERKGANGISVMIVAVIIIVIIVAITYLLIRNMKVETLERPASDELLNLDELVNLDVDGLCCFPTGGAVTTKEWMYSPSADFTFSTNKTKPAIVCQGLTSVDLNNCLNYVSDDSGGAKPVAHLGIGLYYAFAPGQALSICDNFQTC